jgi:Zn finger protein HypA/HybF involved in hydrogenase expression
MLARVTALGIEVSTRCKSCGHVVAVNAFVAALACPTCDRRMTMDATRWHLLLEEPLRQGPTMALHTEQAAPFQTEDGTFHRVYRRADPSCARCQAALAPERLAAMATRGAGFCPSCAAAVTLRPAPEMLASHGVVALLGEDAAQVAGPDAPPAHEPVPLACANCGGSLRIDGRQRLVNCHYCGFNQYLPDELWKKFHPQKPVLRWFLIWGAAGTVPKKTLGERAAWDELADVVVDGFGNLYCAGSMAGGDFAVWSMAPDLSLRWSRAGLKRDSSDAQLAWARSGHLLLWQPDKRTVLVLACADGSTAAQLSGKPGEGGALEMKECEALVCDVDGTILQIAWGSRLLRYGAFGEPMATWGTGPREQGAPEDSHVCSRMSHRPLYATAVKLGVGWDGFLYVHGIFSVEERIEVARYDRSGRRHFMACMKPGGDTWAIGRPSADASGIIYLLVRDDDGLPAVWRVAPDGSRGERWLASRKAGGLLGDERHMAVCPDGSVWMLGGEGAARRFGPDGRVHFLSETSRRGDQQAMEDDDD